MKRHLAPIRDPNKKFFQSRNFMAKKKPLPVRVQNPTSLQHVVRLKPGQILNLTLDDDLYQKHLIEAAGEYLKVETLDHKEKRSEYRIIQTEDFHGWAEYSSCMLGEIWIDSKSTLAKLLVMLDCSNQCKQDHVTLINPFYSDVRVQPHHVMEIILYDERHSYHDKWTCIWTPEIDGLQVEQIGYDSTGLYSEELQEFVDCDPPDYCYAKFPRIQTEALCKQHHFWFRFDESVMALLSENHGVLHAGSFDIKGYAEGNPIRYQAEVYLDARKKYRRRVLKTLMIKEMDEYSVYTYRQNHPAIVYVKKPKSVLPMVRDVAITPVQANSLDEGCKVLSAVPTEELDFWVGKHGGVYQKVPKSWC